MPEPQPVDHTPSASGRAAKTAVRDQLLTARSRRSLAEVRESGELLALRLLQEPEVRRAASVAAYVSVGTEPGTGRLLEELVAAGKRVLLPVVVPAEAGRGLDLDWAKYHGPTSLAPAPYGLLEPVGPMLGRDAVGGVDAVLVPGLAVDPRGVRLGRGAGCYDRALGRVPVGTFTCVLLYDDEVGRDVPAEAHDRQVAAAVSPRRTTRFGRSPGAFVP